MAMIEVEGVIASHEDITVQDKIGKGSQAEVYAAVDAHGNAYAVKVLAAHWPTSKEQQRAEFEIKSNYLLSHELQCAYFPHFYGYWLQPDGLRLLFQKCDSNALTAVHAVQNYSGRYAFVLTALVDCLHALEALHARNIMHRDIKAENILLTKGGFKLGDLGLSRVTASTLLTRDVGNRMSRSPEFYSGDYDCRTDVWSLAVTAFYLLEGTLPFDQATAQLYARPADFAARIASKLFAIDLHPPHAKSPHSSTFLHRLLAPMLATDPRDRPSPSSLLSSFAVPDAASCSLVELMQGLVKAYLGLRQQNKESCAAAVLLAEADYTRFDQKLSQVNRSDSSRQVCFRVKAQLYRLMKHLSLLLLNPPSQLVLYVSRALCRLLSSWQQELLQEGFRDLHNIGILEDVPLWQEGNLAKKFPCLQHCRQQIANYAQPQSHTPLWQLPLKLNKML